MQKALIASALILCATTVSGMKFICYDQPELPVCHKMCQKALVANEPLPLYCSQTLASEVFEEDVQVVERPAPKKSGFRRRADAAQSRPTKKPFRPSKPSGPRFNSKEVLEDLY